MPDGVYACAAKEKDGCIVIANVNSEKVDVNIDIKGICKVTECKIIKDGIIWEDYNFNNQLPAESVIFMKFDL